MLIATFGPTTGWVGKTITFENEQFILQDYGPVTAAGVMEYDRQGHLIWPYDGMRAWVAVRAHTSTVVPAYEAQPAKQASAASAAKPRAKTADVSTFVWSCVNDSDSCSACRALDNTTWLSGVSPPASDPLPTCTNPDGCRCLTVMQMAQDVEEEPADVTFLRRLGGVATAEQMAEYNAEQAAERYASQEGRRRTDKASATVLDARGLEKTDPDKAVAMYREGLAVYVAVYKEELRGPEKSWQPSHIHYVFNRLTMLLVKLGRGAEALKELEDHDALGLPPEGPKADLDAMEKRRERLAKKLAT